MFLLRVYFELARKIPSKQRVKSELTPTVADGQQLTGNVSRVDEEGREVDRLQQGTLTHEALQGRSPTLADHLFHTKRRNTKKQKNTHSTLIHSYRYAFGQKKKRKMKVLNIFCPTRLIGMDTINTIKKAMIGR